MNAKVSFRKKKKSGFFVHDLYLFAQCHLIFIILNALYTKKPRTKQRSHHTAYLQTDLVFLNGSN